MNKGKYIQKNERDHKTVHQYKQSFSRHNLPALATREQDDHKTNNQSAIQLPENI